MDQNESPQDTLVCTKCGADTHCAPDLSNMSQKYAIELVSQWKCSECLDEADQAAADEGSS